jgi:type IV pilus assembly protein PilO
MAINDAINAIPAYQRWMIFGFVLVLVAGGFVWFVYLPKQDQLVALKKEIADLTQEIQVNQEKADRLETLLQEKAQAELQLAALQKELPLEPEAVALLRQIAELGVKSGLDFKLWRPEGARPAPNGLYVEHPVNVEVAGGYHALAGFFDQVGHLQRIVNVTGLKMGAAKASQTDIVIQTTFVATAFAAVPAPPPPPPGGQG